MQFCENQEFGDLCTDWEGNARIPKLTYFLKFRPKFVRSFSNHETGHCCDCMQFLELIKTFQKILKENCVCKEMNCENFPVEEEDNCDPDEICRCDRCMTCTTSKFPLNLRTFMELLQCKKFTLGGRTYPEWKCIENKCNICKIEKKKGYYFPFLPLRA